LGFLDGFIGKSDEEEFCHAAAEIDFDNYWEGIYPIKSGGVGLGDHSVLGYPGQDRLYLRFRFLAAAIAASPRIVIVAGSGTALVE
jgi:hypothetical protein